ncbi:anaphase-promoting complex subunit 4-like [Eriocheir sinensis]|uniref:anaphase-promoting complex subunit 4-like n=1 Tax=Eriocheir sinensis TaxID=95602 RepID=UPI0021C7A02F|nr:anaphase-promoting complex subunit 4-like [Eriocheir sinensis]XP_050707985.1 anaphase-promoting complex subunit 4-like [Eriocheir sinensis]XP_050707986.1 anaphase-promoting complex subunit 4-like [Eriocheir sinensis]XP_050707987.1 anaphase-promoting complex subunit 4-like [Eriocheir sinensis]XP_050707988.1 anaphase-promoting complex subunit 4-like [Eriocheir sinensis]
MAATCIMKQVEERHVANEITKCIWSPKMDLVAIANIKGQVAMHRLSWQRVWVISSPGEGVKVTGLAWRPDSKILAVGYSSGEVVLVDIEDSSSVHRLNVKAEVTSLSWAAHMPEEPTKEDTIFQDTSDSYLPPLPSLSKTYTGGTGEDQEEGWHEGRLLRDQTCLTLLTVGTAAAAVHLYAFGLFHCATVELGDTVPGAGPVLDATPSHDLHLLSCMLERQAGAGREVVHATVETFVLSCRHRELHALARRYGQILGLMSYASHTLTLLEEAWESILLELDHKLADYARMVPEGGVADFLELLVFGRTSSEFEVFLSNELTEKGLKKLGHSIELSYSNIQKLVLRNVQAVGQALVHQLSALMGLARCHDRFGMLGVGVEEEAVGRAVQEAGAFVLKAVELQQVIDAAMTTFKAFLRWLYVVVQRARGEAVPEDMTRGTQQDLTYIAEFLHDGLEDTPTNPAAAQGERRPRFRLERVGQYLKDAPLSCPPESGPNPWVAFLEKHPTLATHPIIFPHHRDRSLMQERNNLANVLEDMASQPARVISEAISVASWVPIVGVEEGAAVGVSQISCPRDSAVYTVVLPSPGQSTLYLARWPTTPESLVRAPLGQRPAHHVEAMPFVFSRLDGVRSGSQDQTPANSLLKLMGAQFYTEETLSVLAQDPADPRVALFIQLWVLAAAGELKPLAMCGDRPLAEAGIPPRDAAALVDASGFRRLEGGPLASLAVSGSRKVALLLSENRRRVRLFEMEVDEDDDDDEDEDTAAQHESIMNASGASDDQADAL